MLTFVINLSLPSNFELEFFISSLMRIHVSLRKIQQNSRSTTRSWPFNGASSNRRERKSR